VEIGGRKISKGHFAELDAAKSVVVSAVGYVELLLLQGRWICFLKDFFLKKSARF